MILLNRKKYTIYFLDKDYKAYYSCNATAHKHKKFIDYGNIEEKLFALITIKKDKEKFYYK